MSQVSTSSINFKGVEISFSFFTQPDGSTQQVIMSDNPLFVETFNGLPEFIWDSSNGLPHYSSVSHGDDLNINIVFEGEAKNLFDLLVQKITSLKSNNV